jgi:hypothetical protein
MDNAKPTAKETAKLIAEETAKLIAEETAKLKLGVLPHLEEYKVMHDEMTLCQREMHQTWLWAIIPAGAVYTWLPLHAELTIPCPVWFIPTVFLIICFGRWAAFQWRITVLGNYLWDLEEAAFGGSKKIELHGMAHYNIQGPRPKNKERDPPSSKHPLPSVLVLMACLVWVGLIGSSYGLSRSLSQTKSEATLSGQVTDSLTGLPVVGATVAVTDSSKAPHVVTTDAAGHYVVPSLPIGLATVTAKKFGYASASSERTIARGTNTCDEVLVPKTSPPPAAAPPVK